MDAELGCGGNDTEEGVDDPFCVGCSKGVRAGESCWACGTVGPGGTGS